MDKFIKDQLWDGLKYFPINLLKSYFIKNSSAETEDLRKKEYICGVCHPDDHYAQIKAANIGWVRFDIPFPYDKAGNLSTQYIDFKERVKRIARWKPVGDLWMFMAILSLRIMPYRKHIAGKIKKGGTKNDYGFF